jgi:hypothetical protein
MIRPTVYQGFTGIGLSFLRSEQRQCVVRVIGGVQHIEMPGVRMMLRPEFASAPICA